MPGQPFFKNTSRRWLNRRDTSPTLPDYLPARMLNEFVYCPRLFFYEWVEGVFTAECGYRRGRVAARKLEDAHDPLPEPGAQRTDSFPVRVALQQHLRPYCQNGPD